MALEAVRRGLQQANLDSSAGAVYREGLRLYVGSGIGPLDAVEAGYEDWFASGKPTHPLTVVRGMHNGIAAEISITNGLTGCTRTFAMACASSAAAIASAVRDIQRRDAHGAIVCGVETPLTPAMLDAWIAMRVYANPHKDSRHSGACMPFDLHRSGLALSEASVAFVLESEKSVAARGVKPIVEVLGSGESSDATHLTNPSVDGQCVCMAAALNDANLSPDDIGYINAHATGTVVGDRVEATAIGRIFGTEALVSSTKGLHGHALGAAGALEAAFTIAALTSRLAPPTLGLREVGPDCSHIRHVVDVAEPIAPSKAAMSNSFAFGGHNVSLVFAAT